MSARRIVAIAAIGALAVGGAGAAIAAVSKDDRSKSEDAVLADAAKRLDVSPAKLRDALKAAQRAQLDRKLDEAVKNGDITRKRADEIRKRRAESDHVLGPRLGGPGMHKRFGRGPGGPHFGAKAEGRSLASVRSALKATARARLDKAVKAGDLTRTRADAMLERLDEKLANLNRVPRHRFRMLPPPK